MTLARILCVAAAAELVAGCSAASATQRQAERITAAIVANDMRPVEGEFSANASISRARIAQWSDLFNAAGTLLAVRQTTAECRAGWRCFDARFEKRTYVERMRLDETGKVVNWNVGPP